MAKPTMPGFTYLTDSVSFYHPQNQTSVDHKINKPSPSLVVLCSWMGAAPKHIAKYTSGYQLLFPQTSILLLQCSVSAISYSAKKQSQLLQPARAVIQTFTNGPIVLHAFSNGGGTIACHLTTQLRAELGNDAIIWDKIILDCLPSIPTVSSAVDAFAFSLPKNPVLNTLGRWIIRILFFSYLVLVVKIAGREDGITWIRRVLNDEAVFSRDAPRLYLYSKGDELVQDWAVKEHAEQARKEGYKVKEQRWEKGRHCGLVVEDREKYWEMVANFLRSGI